MTTLQVPPSSWQVWLSAQLTAWPESWSKATSPVGASRPAPDGWTLAWQVATGLRAGTAAGQLSVSTGATRGPLATRSTTELACSSATGSPGYVAVSARSPCTWLARRVSPQLSRLSTTVARQLAPPAAGLS